MRTLLLLISLIGSSVVLGLPVTEKNARAVEFDDEFHDEAETLIQNFDDLSERLKAVENELKEGLEVNSMQQEFNLKEFDDNDNSDDGAYQQAAAINRHFESDKMAGQMRHRPAVYINEEDEQTGQTGDRESTRTKSGTKKCKEAEWEKSKIEYLPESANPDVEHALKKVEGKYISLLNTKPEYYIENKDHSWHCFIYNEGQAIGYVVIHEKSNGKYNIADEKPGGGICKCYNLVKSLDAKPKIPAIMEEINKPAVKTMWDEWNENNERGSYANRQEGVDPDDYISEMQEDETTSSNTPDSDKVCDPKKYEAELKDYALEVDAKAKEAVDELKSKFDLKISDDPLSFVESKDETHFWHCFLYPVGVNVMKYFVAHKTAEGYQFSGPNEGRDICTCKSLADKLKGDGKVVAVKEDKYNNPMTMWDEWKDENRDNVRNQWKHKNRWESDKAQNEEWEDRNQWKLRNRQEAQEEQRNDQEAYGQEAATSRGRNQWRNNMVAHRQQHLGRTTDGEKMRYNGNQMAYRQQQHNSHKIRPESQWRNNNRVMAQQNGRMRYNGNPRAGARQQHWGYDRTGDDDDKG